MTQQPFNAAALRGAVDLSALSARQPAGGPAVGAPPAGSLAGTAGAGTAGAVVHATDATFNDLLSGTSTVPAVLVLWAEQMPESKVYVDTLAALARSFEARFQVIAVDIAVNPGIVEALTPMMQQAFQQVNALPVVIGLLAGQPMPFFLGVQPPEQVRPLLEKFLEAAVANGVTGRAAVGADDAADEQEPAPADDPLSALHQQAYDAIDRGDLDGAATAYQQALQEDPADEDARLGLGQVELLRRTQPMDAAEVRQAAADRPHEVSAQVAAADLEVVGGHVEDAFARLIDLVRVSAGEDREAAREHLLSLFEVVGGQDPRVAQARRALMSALF
jgi:putative thioredoxin